MIGHSAKVFYFLYIFLCRVSSQGTRQSFWCFWPPNYFLFSLHITFTYMLNFGIFLDLFGIYL
jgi:hypothetical protein